MNRNDSQEKTEQATPKRKKEAKKKGLVARSKDLNATVVLFLCGIYFLLFGKFISSNMEKLLISNFSFAFNPLADEMLVSFLKTAFIKSLLILLPFLGCIVFATFSSHLIMGGINFNLDNLELKIERLNPIEGFLKIFSWKSLFELFKSLLKITLIAIFALFSFTLFYKKLVFFSFLEISFSLQGSVSCFIYSFLIICSTLIIITFFDVPFQFFSHLNQIKMTKQELKDEYKEVEGKPEIKSKINKIRKDLFKKRMMQFLPQADVVITNPTHFALALKYDEKKMKAPTVLVKGADFMAQQIIEKAKEYAIPLVSAPPLARSLYYHVEVGEEIPSSLYMAVAKILAYVHRLKLYKKGKTHKPDFPNKIDIPLAMRK